MARVINKIQLEHQVQCPHCLSTIAFLADETYQSYVRGKEINGEGWIDADCVWNYIDCPSCGKVISVDNVLTKEEYNLLSRRYSEEEV